MRIITLLTIYFYALLSSGTTSSDDDRRWLESLVDLVEYDYEDHCENRASAYWKELMGNGLAAKLERDKSFGLFARDQATEVKTGFTAHTLSSDDGILRRKVKLLLQPGDMLLETEPWIRLVTFGDTAIHNIRFSNNYFCGSSSNCTFKELQNSLTTQQDEDTLRRMKASWELNLPSLQEYLGTILPLLWNVTRDNNYKTVEEYWDSLAEYEAAILKAREIWDRVKPLYLKLHKYIVLKLKGAETVGKPLPVHLFRSLTGEDWSNLIEHLLPQHPDVYQKVHANLRIQDLGGIKAFEEASKLLKELNLGEIESSILTKSVFNSSCPSVLVDWCKPNKMKVATCKEISISNYIDAFETVGKINYKETAALHSNNTYILREANRYSAIYEGIPGFISLLSMNPHALNRSGLYNIKRFNYNPNHHRLVLQLITALRDLPKLNYYLAVDEWRLKVLMGKIDASKAEISWAEFRRNFSLIDSSDVDILGDPYVVLNKPYIGKFLGLILKYQIYQSYAEELSSDESDLISHIANNNERILSTMMHGFGSLWPELVSDLLAKRENDLDFTALTDYYRLLDEYLDNHLDPTPETTNEIEDYNEPDSDITQNEIISPIEEPIFIPETKQENPKNDIKGFTSEKSVFDNFLDNIIDAGDEHNSKYGIETSTVGVLEIKNPVSSGDQKAETNIKEASYNTYWWIGIGVAFAIVILLIAIIAKKRQNHRKALEKQRRTPSHA